MSIRAAERVWSSLLLLPQLPQHELGLSWRRRLRLLKIIAALLLLLLPAIISYLHSQFIAFGARRVLVLLAVVLTPPVLFAMIVNGRRALKNRQEIQRDNDAARMIQQLILPQAMPSCPGFGLAADCRTFRNIGGDFYDVIAAGNNRWIVALADVSGKGMPAALVTCGIHAIIRTQALANKIEAVAGILGEYLRAHTGRYATLLLGTLDLEKHEFEYINAGHNPPLLLRDNGTVEWLSSIGPPLGLLPDIRYGTQSVQLRAGDRLFVYTDGLTERTNRTGENFGEDRLIDAARLWQHASPAHLVDMIFAENERFADGVPPEDDVTLLILKCY